jgi:hypothetical protein
MIKADKKEIQLIKGSEKKKSEDYDKIILDTAFIIYINLTILKESDPNHDKFEKFAIRKLLTTEKVQKKKKKKGKYKKSKIMP